MKDDEAIQMRLRQVKDKLLDVLKEHRDLENAGKPQPHNP